jgi:serine/threonine protein kinase
MSSSSHLALLDVDGTPLRDLILGFGRSGVVVRRGDMALKLPLEYSTTGLSEDDIKHYHTCADISRESLDHEKEVYRRLGQNHGIVSCLGLSGTGLQMALMTSGNLYDYLTQQRPVKSIQLNWFQEMARTLIHIHDRRVIVADVATRNFLLAADLSVKFSDFTESSILPLCTHMQNADDAGYSIYTDIGQLGAVMYEVITGKPCDFDLFKNQPAGPATAAWPRREDLPSTQNIWLGSIIEKCWSKGAFQNARELSEALNSVTLE